MREMDVEWFEPYTQVLDASRGPEWAQWFIGGKLNIAHNCLDRWADTDRIACLWEGESGETRTVTFAELQAEANRVANGLRALGIEPGDRVALAMPMVPEILSILYGCFKAGADGRSHLRGIWLGRDRHAPRRFRRAGAVHRRSPGAPRQDRCRCSRRCPSTAGNIEPWSCCRYGGGDIGAHTPWEDFLSGHSTDAPTAALDSEARAFILYTSGTTGKPKGTVHTHAGCLAQMGKEIWLGFDHRAATVSSGSPISAG